MNVKWLGVKEASSECEVIGGKNCAVNFKWGAVKEVCSECKVIGGQGNMQ